ncbi:ficolin-2-like [Gigantopelta aegis]|uniref:ficolin-2-like n=1 Tax=Gigantopelta aegis TaxID=1735272 RepID=UPI001B88C9DD|nr:ficolin-2-like [Gigantopelta aegis]
MKPVETPVKELNVDSRMVIQRRTDGSEDFYRTWNEYRDGFGDLNNEFWLGNLNIHHITSQGLHDLRIDLEDFDGQTRFAQYKNFSQTSAQDFFRLTIGQYSGDAGDSLNTHRGYQFSARGHDLDSSAENCAEVFKGAWWFRGCVASNLNGEFLTANHSSYAQGLIWITWRGAFYSLKKTVMKIRPTQI